MSLTGFDDLRAEELTLLADNAEHYAYAFTQIGNEEAAVHFRNRARTFKELAAAEDHAQEVFETTGVITFKRDTVTLPEVESTLRELAEREDEDGVTKLSCNVVLTALKDIYPEGEIHE